MLSPCICSKLCGAICWVDISPGPTHVLVVRGLDENADEEMLRYEFSKHAPIKVRHTEIVTWMPCFIQSCRDFIWFRIAGSSSGQRQIHSCFKGICFCPFSHGKLILRSLVSYCQNDRIYLYFCSFADVELVCGYQRPMMELAITINRCRLQTGEKTEFLKGLLWFILDHLSL